MTNPIHESAKDMARHWRTIESAPLSVGVIVWDGKAAGEARYYMGDSRDGAWYWAGGGPCEYPEQQCYPTHWMPLPSGPQ